MVSIINPRTSYITLCVCLCVLGACSNNYFIQVPKTSNASQPEIFYKMPMTCLAIQGIHWLIKHLRTSLTQFVQNMNYTIHQSPMKMACTCTSSLKTNARTFQCDHSFLLT